MRWEGMLLKRSNTSFDLESLQSKFPNVPRERIRDTYVRILRELKHRATIKTFLHLLAKRLSIEELGKAEKARAAAETADGAGSRRARTGFFARLLGPEKEAA